MDKNIHYDIFNDIYGDVISIYDSSLNMLEEDNYMTKFSKKLFVKRNEMIQPECRGLL